MEDVAHADELARAAGERTRRLLAALRELQDTEFDEPSELPGWSRLTVVCHLRYGSGALLRMTRDALEGRPTSYYPDGRERQRPTTLHPSQGETPRDVLDDWESTASELDREWSKLGRKQWNTEVIEPADNLDLGTIPLARLALARLTEVDVHGTDLGIGITDWSSTLVTVGLPTRLRWLSTRRTNHREFDRSIQGSWLLESTDGLRWLVAIDEDRVESRPADHRDDARAKIRGSRRELLALLLGRPRHQHLELSGDLTFAQSFERAFPGP